VITSELKRTAELINDLPTQAIIIPSPNSRFNPITKSQRILFLHILIINSLGRNCNSIYFIADDPFQFVGQWISPIGSEKPAPS
jgi:hypothetical protein